MTVKEAGRKGGISTKMSHDKEFCIKIGKKGGKERAKKLLDEGISQEMHEKLVESGRKGGLSTKMSHGTEFYKEIGRKGGKARRKM